ncbi:dihydrofolate reductase [Candidatus Peregrinibacteria bacterium]|nr:dihydrofolate reductase [Candidatus Peregrinibacteria bacterium]
MPFSIIAAADEENGIGKNGQLPWRLSKDLAYFHDITVGNGRNAVIMGRRTWESLPEKKRPLARRINIVITGNPVLPLPKTALRATSLDGALLAALGQKAEAVFVIGGAQIFAQAIHHPECASIYLTRISGRFGCDVFFPKIDAEIFIKTSESPAEKEKNIIFSFLKFDKIKKSS